MNFCARRCAFVASFLLFAGCRSGDHGASLVLTVHADDSLGAGARAALSRLDVHLAGATTLDDARTIGGLVAPAQLEYATLLGQAAVHVSVTASDATGPVARGEADAPQSDARVVAVDVTMSAIGGPGGGDGGVLGLTIDPASARVAVDQKQPFHASETVAWSVAEGAAGGTIDEKGGYRAPHVPGTFHVVATSSADPSRSATAEVTVVQPTLELLAGALGGEGHADGRADGARFNAPWGVASDGASTAWVADSGNGTVRRLALADGTVTTLAGTPKDPGAGSSVDGVGAAARLNRPSGLAYDATSGTLYVSDSLDHVIRAIVVATGEVTTLAGKPGFSGSDNGMGAAARFNGPIGLALDAGWLYVADTINQTIRRVRVSDGTVETIAGTALASGAVDDVGAAARFNLPTGLASDGSGHLYVADRANQAIRVIALSNKRVQTLCGLLGASGSDDGDCATTARFTFPVSLAFDAGTLYVGTDDTVRAIDVGAAQVKTLAGKPGQIASLDGLGAAARFADPYGLAVAGGAILVADVNGASIRRVSTGAVGAVTTIAGLPSHRSDDNGSYTQARFSRPDGVAVDGRGIIYIADSYNKSLRTLANGTAAKLAALPQQGLGGSPVGLVSDGNVRLYASIWIDDVLQTIDSGTGAPSLLAGAVGQPGMGDGTSNARFEYPGDAGLDGKGNLYVADTWNHAIRRVVLLTGEVTTIAGKLGQEGFADGTADARFNRPRDVKYDGHGSLYVPDSYNHTVRKIDVATGAVTTLAGSPGEAGSTDGIGAKARFVWPIRVAIAGNGDILVVDQLASTIRRIDPATATVTTLAGLAGHAVVQPGPLPAALNQPAGIALTPMGDLIISDWNESCVLRVRAPF